MRGGDIGRAEGRVPAHNALTLGSSHASSVEARSAVLVRIGVGDVGTTVLHNLGLALKDIAALGAALDGAAGGEELLHGHDGLDSLGVEGWLLLDALVDGDGGVGDDGTDDLALNDGLDGLVDVVVMVLADDGFSAFDDACRGEDFAGGFELRALSLKRTLNFTVLAVLVLLDGDGDSTVVVLLGQHLLVNDRLDASLVMVLVDLLIDGGDDTLAVLLDDTLLGDGGLHDLANLGIRVAVIADELLNDFLGGLHFDVCGW